jgi:spore coat protein U-like protein
MTLRHLMIVLLLLGCGACSAFAANCNVTTNSMNFGNYTGGTLYGTATVTVNCPSGTAFQIALNAGLASGATVTSRAMQGGSPNLGYWLYSDAAHTANWGDTSAAGWVTGTGTGANVPYTVYGVLPGNEVSPTHGYNDTITATVTSSFPTATATFTVNATMQNACGIGASNLSFGNYSGALIYGTSIISINCNTTNTPYNVGLNQGVASGASVTNRSMTGPSSALLHYSLYRDSAQTKNWGNTVGTDTVSGTNTGSIQSITVYGQIPPNQQPLPQGNYTDTITATITY